jgi:hypothetical protein
VQKTKYEGIYKESEGVLLNLDNEALKQYKLRKQKEQKIHKMEADITNLNGKVDRIMDLLTILVNDKKDT